jgi:hypothetical protein
LLDVIDGKVNLDAIEVYVIKKDLFRTVTPTNFAHYNAYTLSELIYMPIAIVLQNMKNKIIKKGG